MRLFAPAVFAAAAAAATTLCGCGEAPGETFIALQRDFQPFLTWTRVDLGDAPLVGHPPGRRFGYVSQPATAATYPVGTLIVKAIERPPPESWDIFAMTKRGGDFNGEGARGWEFFILARSKGGDPVILSRGRSPSDEEGHYGDEATGAVSCNSCHGTAISERTDHVLSEKLRPGAL